MFTLITNPHQANGASVLIDARSEPHTISGGMMYVAMIALSDADLSGQRSRKALRIAAELAEVHTVAILCDDDDQARKIEYALKEVRHDVHRVD